ncbi:MAG: glycosyl hydrolase-related protein [Treponema sp.]|jgi:alpha-mannosidase|nr:glycosyl hydrolase-related protein [Treponema sp.]
MLIPKAEARIEQRLAFLERNAYQKLESLEFEIFETAETFRVPPEQGEWRRIQSPAPWGKPWHCAWFRSTFRAPKISAPLFLCVLPNADSLVFLDGKPFGAFNLFHKKLRIDADGAEHSLYIESYAGHPQGGCGPFEGVSMIVTLGKTLPDFPNTFEGGCLLERREAVYSLYYDVRALFELAKGLDQNSLRKARILKGLYDALMGLHFASTGKELEQEALAAKQKIAPLLEAKNGSTTPEVHLIGHAHIDHAWLWHIGETERKAARTFINMTRFIKEYPEFVFIQSQPCQLEIIKNEYPDIFTAVQEAYRSGNWEPNGGMWIEADCNIPSGESLIRQFLVGKKVNRELLGYEADTLWLPDVFGYAAALPQILKGCRIKYFVTSKINWNDTTRFPYETFIWRGIDGTGVYAHFISAHLQGYNGRVNPEGLAEIWKEVQHKEIQSGAVKSIGEGDGGGGTLRADLEMARRLGNLEGAPKAAWKPVSAALDRIFAAPEELPEWRGELYLELHRGTYTTQARTKRNNRRLEFALRNVEFLSALAAMEDGAEYPHDFLLASWKQVLTYQFHDIIPGSSIGRVYEEAEADSARILAELEEHSAGIRSSLLAQSGGGLLVVNDLSWERSGPVTVPAAQLCEGTSLLSTSGTGYFLQRYTDLNGIEQAVFAPTLPSLGWECFRLDTTTAAGTPPFTYQENTLETPFYLIHFDKAGRITSLIDRKRNRELVEQGGVFNALITAEDVPVFWDAWDIDADWTRHITQETRLESTEIVACGPVCFRLRQTYCIGTGSVLRQDLVCYAENPRIDFETHVTWKERRRLLKVEFDTAIDAAQVRCEVQYGHLFRNTHKNLPQDRAKFEMCAHKWIALEEAEGGIALLNDCKYGHDVSGGVMRLSLLRSPLAPDMEADQGEHRFTYGILPFSGSFETAGVIHSAYELNIPAAVECGPAIKTGKGQRRSFCSVTGESVIIESVKAPEEAGKNGKTLVLRLYESLGGRTRTTLRFNQNLNAVYEADMLETTGNALAFTGNELSLEFKPLEIKTLVVTF